MPDTLATFLAGFPLAVVTKVQSLDRVEVVVTEESLRQFRLDPAAGLAAIAIRMATVLSETPPAAVVWCQEGDLGNGLDVFELVAVLGRWLSVSQSHQAIVDGAKRVIVVGHPRRHLIAFGMTATSGVADTELLAMLAGAAASEARQAVVFVAAVRVRTLAAESELAVALLRHQQAGGAVAVLVPDAESDSALDQPGLHLAPFKRLGLHVRLVRFERGAAIDRARLDAFLREGGLAIDSSVPFVETNDAQSLTRRGAYSGTAPYRPQPFDLRTPWFKSEPGMWIELSALPIGGPGEGRLSAYLRRPTDVELAGLLDARRIAAFVRASRISPALERTYSDFRIYNWPRPAPQACAMLLDAGSATLAGLGVVNRALTELAGLPASATNQDGLIEAARAEVAERYGLSTSSAIEAQNALHAYLADLPRGAALRQDYAELARFAPADLGDALEIGSGYGVLAWALSLRARRYVCADLDSGMFRGLRSDLGQAGVVADAHQLPFADGAFDSVIANNVIEHLYDPLAGLQEIRRVLKPGGRLLALVPFDALNNRHDLPAHLWKIDQQGLEGALRAAGYAIARIDIVNLHDLGVPGAFPSCFGFAAMVEAGRASSNHSAVTPNIAVRDSVPVTKAQSERGGRVWPSVRELARFEVWRDRRVVVVGGDREDSLEFEHFGALVTRVTVETVPWHLSDGSVDLVYSFQSVRQSQLPAIAAEIRRVLAVGGVAVTVFRNRYGLRRLARVASYLGAACDLTALADSAAIVRMADDDLSAGDDGYVSAADAARAFGDFARTLVKVSNLTPEDLATDVSTAYPEPFWDWLGDTCGRFVMVRAER